MCVFSTSDIAYLADHFTPAELREEARRAVVKAKVQEYYEGTPEADETPFPWLDFAAACRSASESQSAASKPSRNRPLRSGGRWMDVDQIKDGVDIVGIAGRYTELKKKGRNFQGLCPIHHETSPSFFVYPEQQSWHCFGACNAGGDVIALVMAAENCDFKAALDILGGGTFCDTLTQGKPQKKVRRGSLLPSIEVKI